MSIKEEAIKNLRDIKEILEDLDITFWLDFGTLLGAYRDKDFCEGDEDDIDLSMWDNYLHLKDEIIIMAKAKGFEVFHKWDLEIALKRNGSKVDLFFHKKNKYDAYTHLYDGDEVAKYVVTPVYFFEVLSWIEFHGMMFYCPKLIEAYLEYKYGHFRTKIHRKDYLCINPEQHLAIRDTYDFS